LLYCFHIKPRPRHGENENRREVKLSLSLKHQINKNEEKNQARKKEIERIDEQQERFDVARFFKLFLIYLCNNTNFIIGLGKKTVV
jgi:hypothetical protein